MKSDCYQVLFYTGESELIQSEEGNKPLIYLDHLGYPTGGIGHLLSPSEKRRFPHGSYVPVELRAAWFHQDIQECAKDAMKFLGRDFNLDTERTTEVFRIVAHMAFQLGRPKLLRFEDTQAAILRQDYEEAADEMLKSKWFRKDTPGRAKRLSDRMRKLAVH